MYEFKTNVEPFGRAFLNSESDSKTIRVAEGIMAQAKEMPITIDANLGLCKAYTYPYVTGYSYRASYFCWPWHCEAEDGYTPEEAEDVARIRELMKPWTPHHDIVKNYYTPFRQREMASGHVWGGNWIGHANPDFNDFAIYGTDAMREKVESYRAKNPGKDDFYDSLKITLDAVDVFGGRFRTLADEMKKSESDPEKIKKLDAIIKTFSHAPQKPCEDFVEATILFSFIFTYDGIDSPGHFDQYMFDFWKKTDRATAMAYLDNLWELFHECRAWNLCISGSDAEGNDLTNDLSYAILEVTAKHAYQTPNLTMRVHKKTPDKLLHAAYEAIKTGCGMPTFYNDDAVCPALERNGIPPEDSHRYVMNGCNQIDIQGKSHMGLEDGEVLFPAALDFTLHNGVLLKRGEVFGIEDGDVSQYDTFEKFYAEYLKQLDFLIDESAAMANTGQAAWAKNCPNPFRSLLIEGCIERGVDYKNGGPLYGNGQILAEGIADAADSIANIKKYVYEEKKYTISEVADAMKKDYDGYDEMYRTFKDSELKFGNDIDYVDEIAKDIVDHFNRRLLTIPTFRGGHYSGGCSPYNRAAQYGERLAALPNGKKRDESLLADSIGATPGFDTNGPTALLNSCLRFDHTLPGSGFILNLKFDKSIFSSKEGEESYNAIVRSYFDRGGQNLTFTVVSPDELRDAKIHPECHRDLIVRVGGYSDYFIDLEEGLQDNVIARTSNLS